MDGRNRPVPPFSGQFGWLLKEVGSATDALALAGLGLTVSASGMAIGFAVGYRTAADRHRRRAARADFERWAVFADAFVAWLEETRVPIDRLAALERALERAFPAFPRREAHHRGSTHHHRPLLWLVHGGPDGQQREGIEMGVMVSRRRGDDRRAQDRRSAGDRRTGLPGADLGRRMGERRSGERRSGERRGPASL